MTKPLLQPIDKLSLSLIMAFSLVIGGLVWGGNACSKTCFFHNLPRIKEFSWKNQQVGAEDTAFIITFDRPMDTKSVEQNLIIDPPLPGKISWAGRRLAYTLKTPIPYGETYQVHLRGARERFREKDQAGKTIEPFFAEFKSRDRAFAYIGTQGEEQGQLILYNVTQKKKMPLTPSDLVVMDFKFYPNGDKILFSAAPKNRGSWAIQELQLYIVETGINNEENKTTTKIELILDNKDYQNNQFELSNDGETIVVQRVNRKKPADFDLWMVKPGSQPEKLNVTGGQFLITPDGKSIAIAQGQGIAVIPLQPDAKPLEFLPKFGQVLNFSRDGSAAAMVNFNTDNAKLRYTKSLYYVNNQGIQKELLNIEGSILDCQFSPDGNQLYCLLTQVMQGENYVEQPYFARIDVKTGQVIPLVSLPEYRDMKISLAPDGLGILFDQVFTGNNPTTPLTTNSGEAIIGGSLWLLIPPVGKPVKGSKPDLNSLPLVGFRPQWSP